MVVRPEGHRMALVTDGRQACKVLMGTHTSRPSLVTLNGDSEVPQGRRSRWTEETPLGDPSPNHTIHLLSCPGGKPP